ncbi:hypothetical protein [Variovorax sp. RA8]|uniref:hypothetical protein n=1 Tax=Variovorax sp. (strain JCM 16519 / RA8) TaxID=662548 RepID=UPI000AE38865|nr:hypothetical protein [Variovorax sp. RA8]
MNRDFDRVVMMIQDKGLTLDNSLRFPAGDPASPVLPNAVTRALKGLAFDAAGALVVTAGAGDANGE